MNSKRKYGHDEFIKLTPSDLINKFRSKSELYKYLKEQLQYFIPPFVNVNKDFLRQVFKNQKKLFKLSDIRPIYVPNFDELSNVYPEISLYLPVVKDESRLPERNYFITIINTVQTDYLPQLIEHAHKLRNKPQEQENREDIILVTEEWYENLMKYPYISGKPGKTIIHLLKQNAKFYKGKNNVTRKRLLSALKDSRERRRILLDQVVQKMKSKK